MYKIDVYMIVFFIVMQYKIRVEDKSYTKWEFVNSAAVNTQLDLAINPLEHKLFHNDVFTYDDPGQGEPGVCGVEIVHSTTRIAVNIPGILVLNEGKTYGSNGKKLFYKCVPGDKRIPVFLIPYAINQKTFSKKTTNKYVLFKFIHWNDKHPRGELVNTLGCVSELPPFYEYQLYCKSLNSSLQGFQHATSIALKKRTKDEYIDFIMKKYPIFEDRRGTHEAFTIDAALAGDFDDAISFREVGGDTRIISVYIANVYIWMEVLELWGSFSERIATIYLPDRRRPMIPTVLSSSLCSLKENEDRFVMVLDIHVDCNNQIKDIVFGNAIIKVYKNYSYNSPELLEDINYTTIFKSLQPIAKQYKYMNRIKSSNDVISYLMIFMNCCSAIELMKHKNGIYRSVVLTADAGIPDDIDLPESVYKYLKIWNSSCSQYTAYSDQIANMKHDLLELESYVHITSPIRRLVDLINMVIMFKNRGAFEVSVDCTSFCDKWIGKMDYINTTMRAIRRVQNDCTLLEMCYNNPCVLEKTYEGYLFDGFMRCDGLWQYMVYIPDIKISSRITCKEQYVNYSKHAMKAYLFNDEHTLRRKIRIELIYI